MGTMPGIDPVSSAEKLFVVSNWLNPPSVDRTKIGIQMPELEITN